MLLARLSKQQLLLFLLISPHIICQLNTPTVLKIITDTRNKSNQKIFSNDFQKMQMTDCRSVILHVVDWR